MTSPKQIKGSPLRAYVHWNGRWRHVYVHGSYDQTTIVGDPVRTLYFKLTKASRDILSAEKSKFHKEKPATRSQTRSEGA